MARPVASARGLFRATGNRAGEKPRNPRDYYRTPAWATRALLEHEMKFIRHRNAVWEPACGDGSMARPLAAAGFKVIATDIQPDGFGEALDFLRARKARAFSRWGGAFQLRG